jgi:hypothetical protein
MTASSARNGSSKPKMSISHQVAPAPGPGTARKMKMMTAVPTSVRRAAGLSSLSSFAIRNSTITIEPAKMIS